ncbi:endopeptidase La [Ignatzschineria rhizosphaerae]|uniref:Lon protease n=1 Tax=Ignatzschineria rhizosphaerae TaxID=2923279 RepID=A0ABY3WX81_9GAMM|nr:endopeptidase La [Ignatzschineria rhizosphaerae]UNM95214.1 endopeptidase La [Ignatzschineria rhizosphaerae]
MSQKKDNYAELPILALRDLVVFPGTKTPLLVGRPLSIGALEMATEVDNRVLLMSLKDPDDEEITMDSIYHTGVVVNIVSSKLSKGGSYQITVEAIERVQLKKVKSLVYENSDGFIYDFVMGSYELAPFEDDLSPGEEEVYYLTFEKLIKKLLENAQIKQLTPEKLLEEKKLSPLVMKLACEIPMSVEKKQAILAQDSLSAAADVLIDNLTVELNIIDLQRRIHGLVQTQISKNQREYYLNEQIKAIHKELDELSDSGLSELEELEERVRDAKMPVEAEEKALNEVKRLKSMPAMSAEGTVARTYIDWLLKMPWHKRSRLRYGLVTAKKVLDKDHSGLEKVKDHILEHLAVISHTKSKKGDILCFIGPPGVGKTSLARSIAEATGREFMRMSLGGVNDESEIRGHRRTYIGAMPGKLVQLLTKAKTKNPLILLDELDKTGSSHKGDPADALLEVLDPEQNSTFNDHYLDIDIDLSEVMFIATANSYNIPGPLRDRMDIIELSSYTELEKLEIAKNHLLSDAYKENGLSVEEIKFTDDGLLYLINHYTKEAGVRNLMREINTICRKFIKERLLAKDKTRQGEVIDAARIKHYLGATKYRHGIKEDAHEVGYVNGLAWTQVGGDLLGIEVQLVPGKGELIATGSLGDVMKESVRTALTVIRARSNYYGLPEDFYKKWDIHVHAPEGAIPKDGPSAGAAITLAILSALLGIPIRSDIAMTGEITLRGHVLIIGGLKEKLIAAERAGIRTVLIPEENQKDLEDVPANVLAALEIIPVKSFDEVVDYALTQSLTRSDDWERFSSFTMMQEDTAQIKNRAKTH